MDSIALPSPDHAAGDAIGERPRYGTLAALLGFGLACDLWLHGGISIPMLGTAGVGLLVLFARPSSRAYPFLGAALLLTIFAAIRDTPFVVLDMLGAAGFAVLGASYAREGDPRRAGIGTYVWRGLGVIVAAFGAHRYFTRPASSWLQAIGGRRRVLRAVIVVVPTAALFGLLLASADPVFARALRFPLSVSFGSLPFHLVVIALTAGGAAVLLRYSSMPVGDPPVVADGSRVRISRGEWLAGMACIDALLAVFVAVQLKAFFGGSGHVLDVPGLTYAEYARSGFGQLIGAAVLTVLLVGATWTWGVRERASDRVLYAVLSTALVAGTLVVLVSAFRRLSLYEDAFGWTQARLFGSAFILWLGAVLLCVLVALALRDARWVTNAAVALGLVGAIALTSMNPDAFIARQNLARFRLTGKIDAAYLGSLSADAAPALVAALPSLPPADRSRLSNALSCEREYISGGGWSSWNLGRSQALDALATVQLPACADGGD